MLWKASKRYCPCLPKAQTLYKTAFPTLSTITARRRPIDRKPFQPSLSQNSVEPFSPLYTTPFITTPYSPYRFFPIHYHIINESFTRILSHFISRYCYYITLNCILTSNKLHPIKLFIISLLCFYILNPYIIEPQKGSRYPEL